jgi:hypothetical protein
MPGPDHVLDKGFTVTGSAAYAFGEAIVQGSTNTSCARASVANSLVLGVCQENLLDTVKVSTGKPVVDVRILGITRCIAGAAVARGARVTNDANARAVSQARAAAGAQPANVFGIALSPASANGDFIDVLLTPGATF